MIDVDDVRSMDSGALVEELEGMDESRVIMMRDGLVERPSQMADVIG